MKTFCTKEVGQLFLMAKPLISILFVTFIFVACGTQTQPTPPPIENPDALITALRMAGADVIEGGTVREPLGGVRAESFVLNGDPFWIYEFSDVGTSQGIADKLVEADELTESSQIWSHGKLLVIYDGTDGGRILLISGFIGDPITRPEVKIDEPYPPGIPAAIQSLTQKLEVDPSQVTVSSYFEETFSDSCLGLPQPDEGCKEEETPGWIVILVVEGKEFVVHTDMLGMDVRLE